MAEAASVQKAASATHEDTSQQRAGRRRRTSAEPQRAQQGATAAAAPAALDTLSRLQQLADASPQAAQLRRLQALVDASPQVAQLRRLQALADASPQAAQLRRLQNLADGHRRRSSHQIRGDQNPQLLAPSAEVSLGSTRPSTAWLQMKKSETERGKKFRRKVTAADTINKLKHKVKQQIRDHIFEAKPMKGEINKEEPTGLHAYREGNLPKNIVGEVASGFDTRVHVLNWGFEDGSARKQSTMFPKWMAEDHVNTLIALTYGNNTDICDAKIDESKINKTDTEIYIKRGLSITLKKVGNTVYPEM